MQELKETLELIIQNLPIFSSWRFLIFSEISLICMFICDKLHIMNTSFSECINWGLLITTICIVNKICFQSFYYVQSKFAQLRDRQQIINTLRNLSKQEILRLKYILKQPSKFAYFLHNDAYILLLEQKGLILCIPGAQKYIEPNSIHDANKALAFQINDEVMAIIHKDEFMPSWKQPQDKNLFAQFDPYQN